MSEEAKSNGAGEDTANKKSPRKREILIQTMSSNSTKNLIPSPSPSPRSPKSDEDQHNRFTHQRDPSYSHQREGSSEESGVLIICTACNLPIRGNCIFDDENQGYHSECYQLRRQFEEESEEDDEEDEGFDTYNKEIQKVVFYWRDLYFNKNEESEYHKGEKEAIQSKYDSLFAKFHEVTSSNAPFDINNHPTFLEMKEKISRLEAERSELLKEVKTLTSINRKESVRREEKTGDARVDEIVKNLRLELLEKEQEIMSLEGHNQSLKAKISQYEVSSPTTEERDRDEEFKKLQLKVARIVRLYEEQKQKEGSELAELRQKYQELLEQKGDGKQEINLPELYRTHRSPSIDGLSMGELQTRYEELKKTYESQLAALKGNNLLERVASKKRRDSISDGSKNKKVLEAKVMEAEAGIVKEGAMQYKIIAGADGKRSKAKDLSDAWVILNNHNLEIYASQQERFTKKKVKIGLTGATIEFEKDTKRKKEVGSLRLTTETQGSYLLYIASVDESEEWLKAIQGVCEANFKNSLDEIAAGVARRSHCIPHRFKEHFYTLTAGKCKVCNTNVHGRGLRCIHCQFVCHEKCSTKVPPNCGLADIPNKMSTTPREKKNVSFGTTSSKQSTSTLSLKVPSFSSEIPFGSDVFEVELSQLPGNDDDIPLVVQLCISAIERKGGMEMEGIYRIPGIKGEIEKLRMHFAYGRPNLDDEEWSDTNVIGGALKLWFRLLPGSLLTKELFYDFVGAVEHSKSENEKIKEMKIVLGKLPKRNYNILKYLIAHLQRVAEKGEINKMKADNLGAVFGPSLMRSPKEDDVMSLGYQCVVVEFMIRNYNALFES